MSGRGLGKGGPSLVDDRFDILAVQVLSWTPHLEIAGEICLRQAELGHRVGFVFLDIKNADDVAIDTAVLPAMRRAQLIKVRRLERILRHNGVTVLPTVRAKRARTSLSSADAGISSIDALRNYRVDGAALGIGALCSLVHRLGDSEPDVVANRVLIDRFLNTAYETFLLTRGLIERYRPQSILVSNGRLASSKGTSEAARTSGVKVLFCEIGATYERFYLSDRPPQSLENARQRLRTAWELAGPDRELIAERFFTRDRGGAVLPFSQFLDLQRRGATLPVTGLRRLVYFVSSDDEHAGVEDSVVHRLFESQRLAAAWLCDWVQQKSDTELIIRVHPRMRMLSARERDWWDSLAAERVTVLPAEHSVDSYSLAASADRVVCYRSSMGAEAAYMGKAVILLGDAIYRGLDCVYEPESVADAERLLESPDLQPKPRVNCLPYGYERLMKGTPFRYYRATSYDDGLLAGRRLAPRSYQRLVKAIGRLDRLARLISPRSDEVTSP